MTAPKKILYMLPLLLLMAGIAAASSMPYEQQDLRGYIRLFPLHWVEQIAGMISFTYSSGTVSIEEKGTAGFIEFFIRKGTHFVIYFGMAVLGYVALKPYRWTKCWKLTVAFALVAVFAVIDEIRHFYHPDRTGLWQDVVLDMTGGLCGILFILFWGTRLNKKKTTGGSLKKKAVFRYINRAGEGKD
ncbi:VanZ family protein [Alteribacillus sp. YIM 98480]|uniref:VanZ family protein n=1 Tax=Alteribacillus sp. YIM 98480 TaxID=2606599 RepID=UPI00131BC7AE|nr:VanZ family protein [Alteribacillus sp. YIM 98480]